MAFGNKKLEKQDLIDAGLDPDKLKEFQEKGVTKENLDALKTELTTTMSDLIKAQFTELETKLRTPVVNKKEEDDDKEKPDDFTDFTTDPVGFVNKKANNVAYATAVEIKKTTRSIAYNNALATLPGFRNAALRAEIDEEWKKYPADKMAQFNSDPEVLIKQLHDLVIGKHHDEIVQDRDKKDGKFNIVHAGGSGGSSILESINRNKSDEKPTLTDAEKKVAKAFGMTEDEYIQEGKNLEAEGSKFSKVGV
jgi:hypothetical protein